MLVGVFGGRTTWVDGHTTATDAAGYNLAAFVTCVVALLALGIALNVRSRVVVPTLAALVAAAAFFLSVLASGVYLWARWQGEIWMYATGKFSAPLGNGETVSLAWGPTFVTPIAAIGMVACIGLAIIWARFGHWDHTGSGRVNL